MLYSTKAVSPREMAKVCAYGLVLLLPGSFVVLPLLWLGRRWTSRGAPMTTQTYQDIH
jgi:hypothetical protein